MITNEASTIAKPWFVRVVAIAGITAYFLGRAVAPALRGAREGLGEVIGYTDLAGGIASYLFAFLGLAGVIFELMFTFREKRFSPVYRTVAATLGVAVIILVAPAFREPLPERASAVAALASSALALLASREALVVPRTRVLGLLLFCSGIAALLHLTGMLTAWHAGERALYRLAVFARILSTGSVLFDTLALFVAFAWLVTRNDKVSVWSARVALFVAFVLAWGVARGGALDGAPLWQLVAYRAVDRLLPMPATYVWLPYRYVLETCAPLLGIAALTARGQMPAIVGAFSLALIARPATDVPLSALALSLAALSTSLAARDDRGMWAVLMANSGQPAPAAPRDASPPRDADARQAPGNPRV